MYVHPFKTFRIPNPCSEPRKSRKGDLPKPCASSSPHVMPVSHESVRMKLITSLIINLLLAVSCWHFVSGKRFDRKGSTNSKVALNRLLILPTAIISLCALPSLFQTPSHFWSLQLDFWYANSATLIAQYYSLFSNLLCIRCIACPSYRPPAYSSVSSNHSIIFWASSSRVQVRPVRPRQMLKTIRIGNFTPQTKRSTLTQTVMEMVESFWFSNGLGETCLCSLDQFLLSVSNLHVMEWNSSLYLFPLQLSCDSPQAADIHILCTVFCWRIFPVHSLLESLVSTNSCPVL